jgi:hypothetical protein
MKQIALIVVIVVLSALGGILVKEHFYGAKEPAAQNFSEPAKMERKMTLVSQVSSFADVYGFYKFKLAGSSRFLYSWKSEQEFGIEIPEDWVWGFSHSDGVVTASAPQLVYFGPKVDLSNTEYEEVKSGLFVDEASAITEINERINKITMTNGEEALKTTTIKQLAKLSLESQLLKILQEANPELGILQVSVSFKDKI